MNSIEYTTGRIYKIQVKDEFKKSANMLSLEQLEYINHIYVGSTMNTLKARFKQHHSGSNNHCKSLMLFSIFDKSNTEIVLIKKYIVQKEVINHCLLMYEALHMNKLKMNKCKLINKHNPFRIDHISNKNYRLTHVEDKKKTNKNYYSNNKEYFDNHNSKYYQQNKNNFYCDTCEFYFVCEAYLNKHKNTKAHKLKCNQYGEEMTNSIIKDLYKYTCSHCNINSNDKVIFAKHVKSKEHLALNLSREEEDNIYKFMYTCDRCKYIGDSKKDYNTHLISKSHRELFNITEEYKYKCEVCKYYQNQEKLFNRHLKSKRHAGLAS